MLIVRSGEASGCSANRLSPDTVLLPVRSMPAMRLEVVVGLLALPPVLPAVVVPLVEPLGWFGWSRV